MQNINDLNNFRYAITNIEVKVKNHDLSKTQESSFDMIIPEEAFVSNYSMILNGKTYTAKVEETDKVRKTDQNSQNYAEPVREHYKTESKDTKKVSKTFYKLYSRLKDHICVPDKVFSYA